MVQPIHAGKGVRRGAAGVALALGLYTGLLLLLAGLFVSGRVGEGRMLPCVWLCAAIAGFAGTSFACRGSENRELTALVCALIFWAAVQLIGFLSTDGYDLMQALRLVPPIGLGAVGACLKPGERKARRKRHRGKRGRK